MNWLAIVIASVAATTLAFGIFEQFRRVRGQALELTRLHARTSELEREAERDSGRQPPAREALLIPDYLDKETLEEVARQKGLQVDPLRLEVTESESTTEATSTEVSSEIGIPGTGAGARTGASTAHERARHRAIAADRYYNVRSLFRELLEVLEHDGELTVDLAAIPEAAEDDAMIVGMLMMAWGEWNLSGLSDDDPRRPLDEAIDALAEEGLNRIAQVKQAELGAAVPRRGEIRFALIETEWSVETAAGDDLLLVNEWLVERHRRGERPVEDVLLPGLLEIPLDPSKLTPMGRRRLHAGATSWLRVFGKIETFEEGTLTILPILIAA